MEIHEISFVIYSSISRFLIFFHHYANTGVAAAWAIKYFLKLFLFKPGIIQIRVFYLCELPLLLTKTLHERTVGSICGL